MSKIASFCVVLLLTLTSVFAARRRLNSISELIDFHQGERTNVLELLQWFANTVDVRNNVIWLTFDPNSEYGSHHYGNHENLLDSQPQGFKYYTVGNIHQDTSESLPSYVRNSQRGWNRARIIFSANRNQQINRVFITQHDGPSYDPDYTFEVTVDLLQELRRQHYTDGHRSGFYGNTIQLQSLVHSIQHRFTPQPHTGNNEMDSLTTFCITLCIIVIIIVVIAILPLPKM